MRRWFRNPAFIVAGISLLAMPFADAQLNITPAAGFDVSWNGNDGDFYDGVSVPALVPDNVALSGTAFAADDPGAFPVPHVVTNLNDGFYGNTSAHINGNGGLFMGISLPAEVSLVAVAWGRDNGTAGAPAPGDCCGGQLSDRSVGTFTLQTTTVANPDASTLDSDWTTLATLDYGNAEDTDPGGGFTPWLRHQYSISTDGGDPIATTGIRILAPDTGVAIDEIELYIAGDVPIAGLSPLQSGGAIDADNLGASATAFAKDTLDGRSIGSLNDQTFGDSSAWVGDTPDSFAGLNLGAIPVEVRSIAFGRDNLGAQTDRSLGGYTLQITGVANPDETTPDADWTTIGAIVYENGSPENPHLRHRFNFGVVMATGIRLLTPDGAAIDEFEVYETPYVPPIPPALTITPAEGYDATWDGNDGDFFSAVQPPEGAIVPDNLALAANGGIQFASSESLHFPAHAIANLNDGFYGNANSHINDQGNEPAFVGIALPAAVELTAIAWGRDNGNGAVDDSDPGTDACGGQCDDRSLGTYTLQFTTVASPDATTLDEDWTTIADFEYTGNVGTDNIVGENFSEWLRHQYEISLGDGAPILATGVRILLPDLGVAIDEIELYGTVSTNPFEITAISYDDVSGDVSITFNSQPGKFYRLMASADLTRWSEIDDSVVGAAGTASTFVTNSSTAPGTLRRYFQILEF
ncbi:MAG: hypothetical protein ACI9MB_002940 [Verrucomicrobiales bacterium]|jgi:hypothetical protein